MRDSRELLAQLPGGRAGRRQRLDLGHGLRRGQAEGRGAGTVGADKNSIKIIGEEAGHLAQGYLVYDSKKAGSMRVSHPRFGKKPIRSICLISKADFVACHRFVFLEKLDLRQFAVDGATFLLNSPFGADKVWDKMPRSAQERILAGKL